MQISALLVVFSALLGCVASSSTVVEPSKHKSVELFLQGCVISHSNPAEVADQAAQFGLVEVSGPIADRYLAGSRGRVWGREEVPRDYAISLLADGVCTVFVHEGDADTILKAVESWLPPEGSGVGFVKTALPTLEGLESYQYLIKGGKAHEEWVITVSRVDLPIPLRAAISFRPL